MGPPSSRRLRPPFTRSCPGRAPASGSSGVFTPRPRPPGGSQPITAHTVWAPGSRVNPTGHSGPTQDFSARSLLQGSRPAHSSPFWEPRSRPKGFRPSLLPCLLPPGSDQKRPAYTSSSPLYPSQTFLCKHASLSSGPLPPGGPGLTPS